MSHGMRITRARRQRRAASPTLPSPSPKIRTSRRAPCQPYLLDEIRATVFGYLRVVDRKSIRLVCRRFYDIANCPSLLNSEQHIVVSEGFDLVATMSSLATSRRKIWNLKFFYVWMDDQSVLFTFFRSQGINVRSLIIEGGTVGLVPELMPLIILQCVNLRCFTLFCSCECMDYVLEDFDIIHNDGIVRHSVSSFTLKIMYANMPFERHLLAKMSVLSFFAVFPNIKDLNLDLRPPAMDESAVSSLIPVPVFTFSSLRSQLLEMRHQIEKLCLCLRIIDGRNEDIRHDEDISQNEDIIREWRTISSIEMPKLKDLSLGDFFILDAASPIFYFKHLTKIYCYISEAILENISGSALIQLLLNTAPELRLLRIQTLTISPTYLTEDCFCALVRSQLITLFFHAMRLAINFNPSSLENSLQPNQTLKCLYIDEFEDSADMSNLFQTYFPLHELIDYSVSNEDFL